MALADLAARTQRAAGFNPIAAADAGTICADLISINEVAARALRAAGVAPFGPLSDIDGEETYTSETLALQVLFRLGEADPTEAPNANSLGQAINAVQGVCDALFRTGVINWDSGHIPGRAIEFTIIMAIQVVGAAFGKPGSLDVYLEAENKLREQALQGGEGQTRAYSEVRVVHGRLAAMGLVSWTVDTIPEFAVDCYVSIVAAALIPVHAPVAAANGTMPTAPPAATRMALVEDAIKANASAISTLRIMALSGAYGQALAVAKLQAVHDQLATFGLISWPVTAVPAAYAEDYVTMAATLMGNRDPAAHEADSAMWNESMARVRRGAIVAGAGALAEQKVRAVHASLDARGKTRWSLFDLPDYVEEPYVVMAASLLAPEVDVKVDPGMWASGEAAIDKLIALPSTDRPVQACYF